MNTQYSIGKSFENLLLKPKQKHSDLGDKSNFISETFKRRKGKASNSSKTAENVTNQEEINVSIRVFYSDLYFSKCNASYDYNHDYDYDIDCLNFVQFDETTMKDLKGSLSEVFPIWQSTWS